MSNEIKIELLKQIDLWTQALEQYGKKHQKEIQLFYIEKINLINNHYDSEPLIRKFEQLKYIYEEIANKHMSKRGQQQFLNDTFNTLYNKYCRERTTKKLQKAKLSSQQELGKSQERGKEMDYGRKYKERTQESEVEINIMDEYLDEIDYYKERTQKIVRLFENHSHESLQSQIKQLKEENFAIRADYEDLKNENYMIRQEILSNRQKVQDLKEVHERIRLEFANLL